MINYFKTVIESSEYMKVFITKIFGDNYGNESYVANSEIIKMATEIDQQLLKPRILHEFVWYYNLYISKDTRRNIDIKILRNDLKELKRAFCD